MSTSLPDLERYAGWTCPRCGNLLVYAPETNSLTGKQLRRDGELVFTLDCAASCGYAYRPKPPRRKRR